MTSKKEEWDLINIVIIGRGGMGAVTAGEIIAEVAYLSDNFMDVHAYPAFGTERRGAPVQAYVKLSRKEKIWDRGQIENPQIMIVLDETVLDKKIVASLVSNGIFIINSEKDPKYFVQKYNLSNHVQIIVADINKLAIERGLIHEGIPMVNTPILGLLCKSLKELNLENIFKVVQNRMRNNLAKINIELIEQVYKLAKTI